MDTEPPDLYTTERRILILLALGYFFMVAAASVFQYHRNFRASREAIDSVLIASAWSLDEILEPDFHDRFRPKTPMGHKDYRERVAQLNRLVDRLEIEFLYSMAKDGEHICFVVSNETREDIERGTPSLFYNPYPDPPEQLVQAFDTLTPVFCSYTNQWDRFRSIFLPRKTPGGKVYVLAADIKAGDMVPLLRNAILISLAFALLFLVPVVPALAVYRRMMKKRAADLEFRLYCDPLTGLANQNRLKDALKGVSAKNIACILLNVDAFKEINALFGFDTGDTLLQALARLLEREMPDNAVLYRMPGDEFLILLEKPLSEQAETMAQVLLSRVSSFAFENSGESLSITMTAGLCLGAGDVDHLLSCASIAKIHARATHQPYVVYTEHLHQKEAFQENLYWIKALKEALAHDRVVPFFQPIFNNQTRTVEKYEALVRLIDREGRVVSPEKFLGLAKKSKLYHQITRRMIEKSFDRFSRTPFTVSLNVTIRDLLEPATLEFLMERMTAYGMEGRVVLELVESEHMPANKTVVETLVRLKKKDIQIAIDDFGSGYANFEYLLRLKPDYLKIDGSLVEGVLENPASREVVSAIVSFAKNLDMALIAEYVSSEDIQTYISSLGIGYSQGFYIGSPEMKIS